MPLTQEAFASWLDKYGRAWQVRDAKAAADLYAGDGTYQGHAIPQTDTRPRSNF